MAQKKDKRQKKTGNPSKNKYLSSAKRKGRARITKENCSSKRTQSSKYGNLFIAC